MKARLGEEIDDYKKITHASIFGLGELAVNVAKRGHASIFRSLKILTIKHDEVSLIPHTAYQRIFVTKFVTKALLPFFPGGVADSNDL